MFVKIYCYHIKSDNTEAYLTLQKEAAAIYRKYIDSETTYLQCKEEPTKWMEMTKYASEEEYNKKIVLINENQEINELYKTFTKLLVEEKSEVLEENYFIVRND
ncbi:hypothetical protein [Sutcliffiella rhizosphaerae]|uniref:ABM domain-containing protein n=1 Tax=Sutcliffiella rhizosphaerae TaxID=2880967 RepID=A0ABN8ABC8_9BACI|nr:hypothetical protein [Sutcliffiella rhizosphaerae]CAG9621476.1 hypothetical protein BACCIP111883_02249 [Sutcliffiella rhizosphaerae]